MKTNSTHATEILLPASQHARIGYHPLKVATMVLQDMRAYYLPIYHLTPQDGCSHDALLVFIEGLICQGEEEMERAAKATRDTALHRQPNLVAWQQSKTQILDLLAEEQIAHPRISQYLDDIEAFFILIHKLVYQGEITHPNVVRAMELAPADFRLLHTVFCCASGQPVNEQLLNLLEPLEVLRDIHWHIANLADDLEHGYFNLYQMFLQLHGNETTAHIQAEQKRLEACLNKRLAQATETQQEQIQPMLTGYQEAMASVSFPKLAP